MENLALLDEITTKGGSHVGVLNANTPYILSFDVEGLVAVRLHLLDNNTNQLRNRLNVSMYHKTGTYTHKVGSAHDVNLVFEVVEIDGCIKNIVLEEVK